MKANELVDAYLDNNKSKIKTERATNLVDTYLDEMCGKDHIKEKDDELVDEGMTDRIVGAAKKWLKSKKDKKQSVKGVGKAVQSMMSRRSQLAALNDDVSFQEAVEQFLEKETTILESEYQDYFKSMLAKRGIKSPNQLSKEEQKKFFAQVKAGWSKNK